MGRESLLAHFHENETEYSVRMFLISFFASLQVTPVLSYMRALIGHVQEHGRIHEVKESD